MNESYRRTEGSKARVGVSQRFTYARRAVRIPADTKHSQFIAASFQNGARVLSLSILSAIPERQTSVESTEMHRRT
jgi:hypothetical protein